MSEEEIRGEAQDLKPEDPNATINIKVGFKNKPLFFYAEIPNGWFLFFLLGVVDLDVATFAERVVAVVDR